MFFNSIHSEIGQRKRLNRWSLRLFAVVGCSLLLGMSFPVNCFAQHDDTATVNKLYKDLYDPTDANPDKGMQQAKQGLAMATRLHYLIGLISRHPSAGFA